MATSLDERPSLPKSRQQSADRQQWAWLWRPTALGFTAVLAVAISSSLPDSPFKLDAAGTWYFGEPVGLKAALNDQMLLPGSLLGYIGLATMILTWLRLVGALRSRPGAPLWRLTVMLACWSAPMLIVAPLFSRDLFSYAAQGEMVVRHINPYLHGPSALGRSLFSAPVDKRWINAPAPYGPLFVVLESLAVRLSGQDPLMSLVLLRLVAVFGVALLAAAIPRIARRCGHDPGLAFVVGAASPLVVFTLVAGGHCDALLAGLLAAGVWCALAGYRVRAIALIACAAAIRVPLMVGVLVLAWAWSGPKTTARVRALAIAAGLVLCASILAFWSLVAGFGFGWILALGSPVNIPSWVAPTTWLERVLGFYGQLMGLPGTTADWTSVARLTCVALMSVICGYVVLRIERFGFVKGLGLTLLAIVVCGPVLQGWYLIWGLALLACVADPWARKTCLVAASITPFIGLPGGHRLAVQFENHWPLAMAAILACSGLMCLVPLAPVIPTRLRELGGDLADKDRSGGSPRVPQRWGGSI